MITLSYTAKALNPGIPIYRQPILHCWHSFLVAVGDAAEALPLSQKLMPLFKECIERRRRAIDVDAYASSQMGFRFRQGNSHIETETYMGVPTKICLSYGAFENNDRALGPSLLTSCRIAELAGQLYQKAPSFVTCEPSLASVLPPSLPIRPRGDNQTEIVPFPIVR